ncbi:hypothetical protein HanXRQr2_Chr03g0136371 [Helianthus annuus]|uniref:Uncharacterized protein n=1 Tax=Helianthus annuus TaxID=4232 RepID=A0A251VBI5_HELAN|nr:hypothetical protein HanXRQr2_Chr03g0136371 [Helianthus annuus]KAJ0945871.1 hypothetical protein HanPSC8_Chr03g0132891 [Helianthus annuus]
MELQVRLLGVRHVYEPPGAPVAPIDDLGSVPEKDKRLPLYKEGKRYDEEFTPTENIPTITNLSE